MADEFFDLDLLRLAQEGVAKFGKVVVWGAGLDGAVIDQVNFYPGYQYIGLRLKHGTSSERSMHYARPEDIRAVRASGEILIVPK